MLEDLQGTVQKAVHTTRGNTKQIVSACLCKLLQAIDRRKWQLLRSMGHSLPDGYEVSPAWSLEELAIELCGRDILLTKKRALRLALLVRVCLFMHSYSLLKPFSAIMQRHWRCTSRGLIPRTTSFLGLPTPNGGPRLIARLLIWTGCSVATMMLIVREASSKCAHLID